MREGGEVLGQVIDPLAVIPALLIPPLTLERVVPLPEGARMIKKVRVDGTGFANAGDGRDGDEGDQSRLRHFQRRDGGRKKKERRRQEEYNGKSEKMCTG
jgi:hypothetical protein